MDIATTVQNSVTENQMTMVEDNENINYMLKKLDKYKKWTLTINTPKTEYLIGGGIGEVIKLNVEPINNITHYQYVYVKIIKIKSWASRLLTVLIKNY